MLNRQSMPSGDVERPGLIGKILRRTRSKQNVQPVYAPAPTSTPAAKKPATTRTTPPPTAPKSPAALYGETQQQQHDALAPREQTKEVSQGSYLKHKKSKPSLVSLMQPLPDSSNREPETKAATTTSQPKVSLRSRFNKKEHVELPHPRRTQSQDGFGYMPRHAASSFQRTTGLVVNAGYHAPAQQGPQQRRRDATAVHIITAGVPGNYEPVVEIHDGTEDDSSDYQKFVQQAIEDDRRQREAWRALANQQTYKVVAEATAPPPPKQGIFSWQRSAAKKQKEDEERQRRTFAGEGQLYGFPASEASCELSRKSLSRKSSRSSSRLSRKSSLKQLIVDYIKPPTVGSNL